MQQNDMKQRRFKVQGTALKPGVSRNGRNYTLKNITENSGKEIKLFYGDEHKSKAENVVGKVNLYQEGENLLYEGWMINTTKHPDAVYQAAEGLLDVSITASPLADDSIDIRNLHLVASPGVEGASAMLVESFNVDRSDSEVVVESEQTCDDTEQELTESEKRVEENKMEVEQMQKEIQAAKEMIVESIMELNPNLVKEELVKESFEMLKLRKEYEKKLIKESEETPVDEKPASKEEEEKKPESETPAPEQKPDVEEKSEDEGSKAVVEPEQKKEEVKESFMYDSKSGLITLTESAYKEFNDEIKNKFRGEL